MEHEYSFLKHDRSKVYRVLAVLAAGIAGWFSAHVGLVSQYLGAFVDPVAARVADVGVGIAALYLLFDVYLWRFRVFSFRPFQRFLGLHDLSGRYRVSGTTLGPLEALDNGLPRHWQAEIEIRQRWTRVSISQRSAGGSESWSQQAALKCQGGRAVLMYSYRNDPSHAQRHADNLQTHVGYCELTFEPSGETATGFYFNNNGRITSGEMRLTKMEEG